ncbi:MAG: hypothetical protein K8U03_16670 [Planctomycetia bacterium]|nr:hypothetical protein [Planctomycetia bacterium]
MRTNFSQLVRRSGFAIALACAFVPVAYERSSAAEPAPSHGSHRELEQDALRTLPVAKLTPQGKSLTDKVLKNVTVFRRLPHSVIECDPEMFTFLVDHPDMVINMWEVMGVSKVSMKKIGPASYHLDDGQGTTGDIHYLYRSASQHLVYCEGTYVGTLVPRAIKGRCLLSMRSAHVRDADDHDVIQCRLDSFVQLDNIGIEIFAKTFQNMIGTIADHNFRETTGFASTVSRAAESGPEGLQRISDKCERVSPQTKQQFVSITDRIYREVMGLSVAGVDKPVGTPETTPARTAQRRAPATTTAPKR